MSDSTRVPERPPGFAIHQRTALPDPELVDAFRGVATALVSDCLGRCIGATGLNAYHGSFDISLCGPALTVRTRPGDNLLIHKAIAIAEPGDVIVVDGAGDVSQALVGGLMRTAAIARQLGGFVLDGAIRDVAEWAEGVLPVYARGHVHRGPTKDGPGEINVPIACAGLAVAPGDLVLGDADGVIAVPPDQLRDLLPKVRARAERERETRERYRAAKLDADCFDELLRQKGFPV